MSNTHPFRFGVVAAQATSAGDWGEKARRAEAMGFSTLLIPDTLQFSLSPFVALAAAASATKTLRMGTYVLANGIRNPVLVAKDAATLDLLSGGRFELGLGAGRSGAQPDFRALGLEFESGGDRVRRLAESLAIVRPLLAGERVDVEGEFYSVHDAAISPRAVQSRVPILVAGAGKRLLGLAARQADIVALGVPPDVAESLVAERIGWLREAAGERFPELEVNLNLMAVAGSIPRYLTRSLGAGAAAFAQSDALPVLKGTTAQMVERLLDLRERLGISYFVVGDKLMDALAPVVARLAAH